jgi:hypothetical protein
LSEAHPAATPNRTAAWGCAVGNLVLPGLGALGVVLFLLAWIWSVASSVAILHNSRKTNL